ncbi:hypothetical protein ES705_21033 [subsurface metagenome]
MMKKSFLLTILIIMFLGLAGYAQDCTLYFPADEGTILEVEHFDRKGNLTGSATQKIINMETSGSSMFWTVQNTIKDDKGEELMNTEMTFECRDGIFYFDINNYLSGESMAAFESMEFRIEGDNLEFPPGMKAGDVLKDGQIRMIIEEMPAMNTTTNRTVEAVENITTGAGTFECFKISYDIETKAMMTFRAKGTEWIAKDVGVVRSESYNRNGKLTGYSELARLEK